MFSHIGTWFVLVVAATAAAVTASVQLVKILSGGECALREGNQEEKGVKKYK